MKADALWTMAETADHCGVSPRTVQRWLLRGELPMVKFGEKTVRIPIAAVRASAQMRYSMLSGMHATFGLGTDVARHRPVSGPAPNVT